MIPQIQFLCWFGSASKDQQPGGVIIALYFCSKEYLCVVRVNKWPLRSISLQKVCRSYHFSYKL